MQKQFIVLVGVQAVLLALLVFTGIQVWSATAGLDSAFAVRGGFAFMALFALAAVLLVHYSSYQHYCGVIEEVRQTVQKIVSGDLEIRDDERRLQDSTIQEMLTLRQKLRGTLNEFSEALNAMASGELGRRIEIDLPGEFAHMKKSVNSAADKLEEVILSIQSSSQSVNDVSRKISAGNTDLSQRTEQQAASLEEATSTVQSMNSIVRQNAELAAEADNLARNARKHAEHGSSVLKHTIAAMQEIKSSSDQIGAIISVIDDIAFQTNLLALNASVEAARAGEQGRGFGVVANEVRNLAQRSAEAAKEIDKLISDSNAKVKEGVRLVNQSGDILGDIEGANRSVCGYVEKISVSTSELTRGFDDLSMAMQSMDQVTQLNASLVGEVAAAFRSMESQAQRLSELTTYFHRHGQRRVRAPITARSAGAAQMLDQLESRGSSSGSSKSEASRALPAGKRAAATESASTKTAAASSATATPSVKEPAGSASADTESRSKNTDAAPRSTTSTTAKKADEHDAHDADEWTDFD